MRGGAVRIAGRCLGLAAAVGAPLGARAQSTQTGMIVSAGIDAETNPYNGVTSDGASLAATAALRPELRWRDASSSLDLSALADYRQFFRRYGLEQNYTINANVQTRRSDRLDLHANGLFAYNEGGCGFGGAATGVTQTAVIDPATLVNNEPLPVVDAAVLGRRTKSINYGAGVGFDARLGARSQLSGDVNAQASRYSNGGYSDYNNVGGELRFSHGLNELTSVGVIAGVSHSDYLNSRAGDATVYNGLLSYDRRFNARWSLSLSAGAAVSDIRQPAGQPDIHTTSLSARGQFCRKDERSQLCISGQRSPQPTANGSVRVSSTLSLSYSLRLSERETLGLGSSYARTGAGQGFAVANLAGARLGAAQFLNASARYDRQVRDRLAVFVTSNIAQVKDGVRSARPNIGAALGVQYRLGALR